MHQGVRIGAGLYFGFPHAASYLPGLGFLRGKRSPGLLPPSRVWVCKTCGWAAKEGRAPQLLQGALLQPPKRRVEDTRNINRPFSSSSWCSIAARSCNAGLGNAEPLLWLELKHIPAGSPAPPTAHTKAGGGGGEEAPPPRHHRRRALNGTCKAVGHPAAGPVTSSSRGCWLQQPTAIIKPANTGAHASFAAQSQPQRQASITGLGQNLAESFLSTFPLT